MIPYSKIRQRLLTGAFIHGSIPIAVVYALEHVGPEVRIVSFTQTYESYYMTQSKPLSIEPGQVQLVTCFLILVLQTCLWSVGYSKSGKICH